MFVFFFNKREIIQSYVSFLNTSLNLKEDLGVKCCTSHSEYDVLFSISRIIFVKRTSLLFYHT